MQVEVPVLPPVFRLTILVFTNTSEIPDVDTAYTSFDTFSDDVLGEAVEEVGTALRPRVVQTSGLRPA